jgi:transcriptional regulatory protein AMDR
VDTSAAEDGEYVYKQHRVELIDQPHIAERLIDQNARIAYIGKLNAINYINILTFSTQNNNNNNTYIYPGTRVSNINYLVRQNFGSHSPDVSHYPTNRLSRRHTCHEPDRFPVEALQLPARSTVDLLLDAYFTKVNSGFPVVDEDLFMAQYRERDPLNPPILLLLHAILVVGAHVTYDQAERESFKAIYFRRAKNLFDARFERNRDTVIQAALLLCWHTDGPEDVAANAWFWLGVAVRTATGLGMHRNAENSTIVAHNKRIWRRVWWLLFQYDVLLSLQYGRPQSIRLEDSDVQKLQPSDFQDCGSKVQVDYVIQNTELCIIISVALRERFQTRPTLELRQASIKLADDALAHWCFNLPSSLHISSSSSLALDVWSASLQLHYNMTFILLHRSSPNGTDQNPGSGQGNSEICVSAAGVIQSMFEGLCKTGKLRYLWISSVNCIFTALIQLSVEVQRSSPIIAVAALRRYDSALS